MFPRFVPAVVLLFAASLCFWSRRRGWVGGSPACVFVFRLDNRTATLYCAVMNETATMDRITARVSAILDSRRHVVTTESDVYRIINANAPRLYCGVDHVPAGYVRTAMRRIQDAAVTRYRIGGAL